MARIKEIQFSLGTLDDNERVRTLSVKTESGDFKRDV